MRESKEEQHSLESTYITKTKTEPSMTAHKCNPNTQEAEAELASLVYILCFRPSSNLVAHAF